MIVLLVSSLGGLYYLYHEVRLNSETSAIQGNLAQLAACADQYFLEHDNESCSFDDLVGQGKYIKVVDVVRGENYRDIFPVHRGFTELSVATEDGHVVTRPHPHP